MYSQVFARITAPGKHSLYLKAEGKEYYLFSQNFYKSVNDFFRKPIELDKALDFSFGSGDAVQRTHEKLRAFIPYVEKEYGIKVLGKSKKAKRPTKTARASYHEETDIDEVA